MKKVYSILVTDSLEQSVITCDNNHPAWNDSRFGCICKCFPTKEAAQQYLSDVLTATDKDSDDLNGDMYQCQYDYACGYVN